MRTPRQRVLKITVSGLSWWTEDAAGRTVLEVQHKLATEMFPGKSVRVREQYLGGAKGREILVDDSV